MIKCGYCKEKPNAKALFCEVCSAVSHRECVVENLNRCPVCNYKMSVPRDKIKVPVQKVSLDDSNEVEYTSFTAPFLNLKLIIPGALIIWVILSSTIISFL